MPRQLFSLSKWHLVKIDIKEARCGDILFVKNRQYEKLLSHIALFINANQIFHCCQSLKVACIQPPDAFFSLYEQKLNFVHMVRYIDLRNDKQRKKEQGIYIKV